MKKIYSFFLLLGLLLSVGNAWADADVTYDFTGSGWTVSNGTLSNGTVSFTGSGPDNFKMNTGYFMMGKNGAVLNFPTYSSAVEKIVVIGRSGASGSTKENIFVGNTAVSTETTGATGTNTYLIGAAYQAAGTQYTLKVTSNHNTQITKIEIYYASAPVTPTCATPTFTPAAGTYTSAQNVSIACTTEGSVIHYTTNGTDPTDQSATYSTPIAVNSNTTIKAIAVAEGYNNSVIASAEYNIVNIEHAGTQQDPYTIADARNAIDANIGISNVYATGVVSEVIEYNETYHNITYNISADGLTTSDQLQAYRGKSYNGDNFTSEDDIQVGDVVVIYGSLTKYNSTYEFAQNNQLVSLNRPGAAPVINADNVDIEYDATSGEIAYTVSNSNPEVSLTATSSTPWISNINVTASKVTFTTTENDGDLDREGFITLSYTGAENKVITVTQAHFVPDYANLPFEWAGGVKADLLSLVGVTASGLGDDYGDTNAPYLVKLDHTGDYIQVKTDSQPAKVTIGVKMIGGASVSSISVQESADGENFSQVELLAISGNQGSVLNLATTNEFAATTRFVKMVFTKGSNVGVGPITITKVSNDPSIEFGQDNVEVDGDEHDGTITVTYKNFTLADAEVHLCDAEGNDETYSWLTASINNANNIYYIIGANEGETRTAYMKVVAMDNETNLIYSDLITITQGNCVYAVLPFAFDGGKDDIDNTYGLTQEGLGSDYGSSPKLKFDGTDDEIVLRINEDAGVLSFDIKGNSFSGGSFSVKVSADGSNYSNLDEYTNLSGKAATNMAYNLAEGVRYIKWIYTEKVNGNVALGNIKIRKPASSTVILGANGYSTYAIDYKFEVSGADVYKAEYDEQQNAIVLTQVNVIESGEGVVLKGSAENASVLIIPSAAVASDFSDNELVGVLTPVEAEANWYVLATIDQDGITKFHHCNAGVTIPANKAYIEIGEATAPGAIRIIENATDINNIEDVENAVKFIENGQLFIKKNGVIYNAVGAVVK